MKSKLLASIMLIILSVSGGIGCAEAADFPSRPITLIGEYFQKKTRNNASYHKQSRRKRHSRNA